MQLQYNTATRIINRGASLYGLWRGRLWSRFTSLLYNDHPLRAISCYSAINVSVVINRQIGLPSNLIVFLFAEAAHSLLCIYYSFVENYSRRTDERRS